MNIVIFCTILSALLIFVNIFHRIDGLRRKKYQLHPFGPISWGFSSFLTAVYVLQSGNFYLFWLNIMMMVLNIVMVLWALINMRRELHMDWRIKTVDFVFLGGAIVSGVVFYLINDALIASVILLLGNILGEIPQLRKDWLAPRTDEIKIYTIPALRRFVSIGTMTTIDLVGLILTFCWGVFDLAEAVYLLVLQKTSKKDKTKIILPNT